MDTLAVRLAIPPVGYVKDFEELSSPLSSNACLGALMKRLRPFPVAASSTPQDVYFRALCEAASANVYGLILRRDVTVAVVIFPGYGKIALVTKRKRA